MFLWDTPLPLSFHLLWVELTLPQALRVGMWEAGYHAPGQGAELMDGPCPKFWEAKTGGESCLPPEDKAIGG